MSQSLGEQFVAMVTDKNEKATYVQKEGVTYKVTSEDASELELGQTIEGFAYVDKQDNHSFTTVIPEVRKGHFGWGEVVQSRRDLGVFVDVGWPNKDVVISMDDLPEMKQVWPKKGDKLFLTLEIDKQNRMWGKPADEEEFLSRSKPVTSDMHNQDISGYVFDARRSGTLIYSDDHYIGYVHESEREAEPRLGEYVSGRVIGKREDDVLYLSLLPRAYEVLDEDAAMILEVLKRSPEKYIPFNDKSKPEDIRKQFGISKGQFKRALGRLMKQRIIKQDKSGTKLIREKTE